MVSGKEQGVYVAVNISYKTRPTRNDNPAKDATEPKGRGLRHKAWDGSDPNAA